MKKNTPEIQGHFKSNPSNDTLWYTRDGMPFKTEHDANNQSAALVKKFGVAHGGVTAVTKAEAFEVDAPAEPAVATIDHEVTQEDLDKNPDLVAQGVVVGDTIQIPADATQTTAEEIADDVAKAAKKPVKKAAKKK